VRLEGLGKLKKKSIILGYCNLMFNERLGQRENSSELGTGKLTKYLRLSVNLKYDLPFFREVKRKESRVETTV
jgi:hypothetical protein